MSGDSISDIINYSDYSMDLQPIRDKHENNYKEILQCYERTKELMVTTGSNFDFIGLHLKFADVAPLNVLLEVEKKKIEAELNLLEQEVDEGESISKEETQNLIDRLVLKDFERSKTEKHLKQILRTKALYTPLNINMECVSPNMFKIFLLHKSSDVIEETKKYLLIQIKKQKDCVLYKVLEQYCLPEDVFERLNHELMVSDNLISFLVNVKKYLMT